jgi:GTP cyclohydrolase I
LDKEKIIKAVEMILEAVGEDKNREGLRVTPQRVANMYTELFGGL